MVETIAPLPAACGTALAVHLRPDVFQALCDPTRLALVARLATAPGPLTVTEAAGCCGVHLSGTSRHLATLKAAGIVRAERRGREVRYQLDCDVLVGTLRGLADAIEDCRAACCGPATDTKGSPSCRPTTSTSRSRKRTPRR
jgi:ArsR family transcriptional regulator